MTTTSSAIIKKMLLLFLVFAGLHFAKVFLMPLSIAGVLATLFLPFCKLMEEKKVPKVFATIICVLVLILTIIGIGALLGWQISELTTDFSKLSQKASETGNRIQEYIVNHFGISTEKQSNMLKNEQPSVTGIMQMVAGSFAYIFTNLVLILAYTFLLLYYRVHIRRFIIKLTPTSQQNEMNKVLYSITHVSQQYLLGIIKMIVCLWIMYGIGFSIIGVKNVLFFTILCGLLEIIPFIGNLTGIILTLLIAAMQGVGLPTIGGIIGTYFIVQFIQEWILSPIILGSQVKINPFSIILALVLGKLVWGIPGIFLAIPLMAMFKIVCDHIEPLKPYGFLIGEIETKKGESGFIKKIKNWFKKKRHK